MSAADAKDLALRTLFQRGMAAAAVACGCPHRLREIYRARNLRRNPRQACVLTRQAIAEAEEAIAGLEAWKAALIGELAETEAEIEISRQPDDNKP